MSTALDVARDLTRQGWRVIPVPYRSKNPGVAGWQRLRLSEAELGDHFNGAPKNIGGLLGTPSEWRVDVDLDCPEAIALAPHFLPETLTFGRASKPRSHWIYRCEDLKTAKFKDPCTNANAKSSMLLELRSTGCQTVLPGSVHQCGEPIQWTDATRSLTEIAAVDLLDRGAELASASLLARYWPDIGGRHDAALHLSGALVRAGWDAERAAGFVRAVCVAAGCTGTEKHAASAYDAAHRIAAGENVTGWPTLVEALPNGERVVRSVKKWLRIREVRIPDGPATVKAPADAPRRWYELTDLGNGERLAERHGRDMRFCHQWGKWLVWDGRRWAIDVTGAAERRAKETVRSIYQQAAGEPNEGKRQALVEHARASESARAIAAMLRLATSEPDIPVCVEELDRNAWILPVKNGTLELGTGTLREHRRADLCTRFVSIPWDPTAECPTWHRFLRDVMANNERLIAFLQRAIGYTLTAETKEQVLFFLLGVGSNGKSTLLRILLDLLGAFATQAAPDLLLAKRGETHPTEQADLFGKRLAVCTEVESGRAFAEVTIKQLTGGDLIKARRMREDFWEFEPTHKLWLAANHKPIVRGTDYAIWRRLLLIAFDVVFGEDRKDPDLLAKLRAELPGILRWAVGGCLIWQRDGLRPPPEVLDATARYREEMDVIGAFLLERTVKDRQDTTKAADLYKAFAEWCDANGERAITQKAFGLAMTERGFERVKRHGTYVYLAIRMASCGESSDCARGDDGDDQDRFPGSSAYVAPRGAQPGNTSRSSPSSPESELAQVLLSYEPAERGQA